MQRAKSMPESGMADQGDTSIPEQVNIGARSSLNYIIEMWFWELRHCKYDMAI
jgi:hypothetical protein